MIWAQAPGDGKAKILRKSVAMGSGAPRRLATETQNFWGNPSPWVQALPGAWRRKRRKISRMRRHAMIWAQAPGDVKAKILRKSVARGSGAPRSLATESQEN